MAKFRILGSGSEGSGAGYIGKKYFATANEIYETEDIEMIELIRNSKMAIEIIEEIIEEIPIINEIPITDEQPKQRGRPKIIKDSE